MRYSTYKRRLCTACAVAIAIGGFTPSARAYDLTGFVATLAPISYQGDALGYDSTESETDTVYFDLHAAWAAPGVIICDAGSDVIVYVWLPSSSQAQAVYEGTSSQAAAQALVNSGFAVGGTGGTGNGGTSAVSLGSEDGGNLKGAYQVALWIFGAVLMLPIILKVRPA